MRKPLPEKQLSTEIREFFQRIGSKGGKKGGKVRAGRLTPKQRSDSARAAANARWAKSKPDNR